MFFRRRDTLIQAGVLLVLVVTLAVFFISEHQDRAYLTYRYARNFAEGRGLAYNAAQPAFLSGAVSAPFAILLGLLGLILPEIPALANLLGVAALLTAAFLMMRLAEPAGAWPARLAGAVVLFWPLLWVGLGQESPLWLALCLAGVWLHLRGWGSRAAACLGLATLIRPDAAILVIILAAHAFRIRRPLVFLPMGVYAALTGLGGMIILAIFQKGGLQSPYLPPALAAVLPEALGRNLLTGLGGLLAALIALTPLWLLALALCLAGLVRLRSHDWAILLLIWAVLHLAFLAALGVGILARDLTPLFPALAGLMALGAGLLLDRVPEGRVRLGALAGLALVTAGAALFSTVVISVTLPADANGWRALAVAEPDPRAAQAAAWLRQNAPPDALVASSQAGLLGYQVDQPMLDYFGALQPDVGQAAARGDTGWWLQAYSPNYIAVNAEEVSSASETVLSQDDWFASNYQQAASFAGAGGSTLLFQRTTPPQPVTGALIGFTNFPDGVTVNGIASDFSLFPLQGGRTGLVRLEWLLNNPVPVGQTVTIRIQGRGGGAVAGLATRTVDFSHWPLHQLVTTFHPITLAPGLPSGVYDVEVGIGPTDTSQIFKTIAVAKVPFQGGTDLGGISGTRAEFGDISLLGYRVGLRPEGLQVFLLWQANHAIAADYHIDVQVRDAGGAAVTTQDVEPHNGAYPTSVWSPGEQVTDTILLPVSQIPAGEYDVYVGLSTIDGIAVRTADGKDAVFVGHISIAPP